MTRDEMLFPPRGGNNKEGFPLPSQLVSYHQIKRSEEGRCYRGGGFVELYSLKNGFKIFPASVPVLATPENLLRIGGVPMGEWYYKVKTPDRYKLLNIRDDDNLYYVWVAQRFEVFDAIEFSYCFIRKMRMIYHPRTSGHTPADDREWLQLSLTGKYRYGYSIRYFLAPWYHLSHHMQLLTRYTKLLSQKFYDLYKDEAARTKRNEIIFWDRKDLNLIILNRHWGKRDKMNFENKQGWVLETILELRNYYVINGPIITLDDFKPRYWREELL